MTAKIFTYPVLIREHHLDTFGHVNNATYLELFEEARWEIVTQNGYGLKKIHETQLGPAILEIKIQFLKEIRLREEIIIETQLLSYEKKIAKLGHRIINNTGLVYCTAEVIVALFDIRERKLVLPTPDWLKAIGAE